MAHEPELWNENNPTTLPTSFDIDLSAARTL